MIKTLLKTHWQGHYSLSRSLFLHTLLVNLILLQAQRSINPHILFGNTQTARLVLILFIASWAVLLVWQLGGCFKAARKPDTYSGSGLDSYLVLFGTLIALGLVLPGIFSLFYSYTDVVFPDRRAQPGKHPPYRIEITGNNALTFSGEIHFGATRDLESILQQQPGITTLVLSSEGGIIVEARGMANAVERYRLNTHVHNDCFSACTLVYISGQIRTLDADARLGFHQYAVDSHYPLTWIDTRVEHGKDQDRFRQQAISPWFIDKMYSQPHHSIWIPSHDELMQAGVLTRLD